MPVLVIIIVVELNSNDSNNVKNWINKACVMKNFMHIRQHCGNIQSIDFYNLGAYLHMRWIDTIVYINTPKSKFFS